MSASSAPRWRCVASDAISLREWDGELVVRNERTGSTHLLGSLAGGVLKVLLKADSAASTERIATQLSDAAEETTPLSLRGAIDEVLSEFKRLGLAEPQDR